MAKTAKSIVAKAKGEIGTTSKNNKCKYNTEYYGKAVSGNAYPWCCVFVWWVFKHCGAKKLFYGGKKTAYVPAVRSWGINKGLTVSRKKGKKGDLVIFDWSGKQKGASHIGIIEKKLDSNTYQTIEGNTSTSSNSNGGKVMRRKRDIKYISYIIRPKYKKEEETTPTPTPTPTPTKKKYSGKFPTGIVNSKTGTSKNIKRWQKFLKWCGNYKGKIDGSFGPATIEATKKFQKKVGLTQDGSCGEKTLKKAKSFKK